MQNNLKNPIIQFLANEFKLDPANIDTDLNFFTDLNLTPDQLSVLLQRLQDALDFSLPVDRELHLETIQDLLTALNPELETEE